jgi:hypothetical protein
MGQGFTESYANPTVMFEIVVLVVFVVPVY